METLLQSISKNLLEENLEAILNLSPDAFVIINEQNNILYTNAMFHKLFGYENHELNNKPIDLLIPKRFLKDHDSHISQYKKNPKLRPMGLGLELFAVKKNGTEFPVDINLNPIKIENRIYVSCTIRNITFRKQKEKKLTDNSNNLEKSVAKRTKELKSANLKLVKIINENKSLINQFDKFFSLNLDLFCITNFDGRFVRFNKAWENILGFTSNELREKRFIDLVHPKDKESIIKELRNLFAGGTTISFETRFKQKKGSYRCFSSVAIASIEDQLIFVSARDVTVEKAQKIELQNSNKSLIIAKEKAEIADRLKSAFLATMSHELRTPLNSIIGFTSTVLKKLAGPLTSEQENQLSMVKKSSYHLLELINDILDLSKIEAGELKLSFSQFDYSSSVRFVCDTLTQQVKKKGLKLIISLDPSVNEFYGDKRRIEQIFLNLANNAVKFTDEGEISISVKKEGEFIINSVKDTGIGIKDTNYDKLFKPFSQIETGLSRKYEGTGLGLSICSKLLDLMQGDIICLSELGKGSEFIFKLPIMEGGNGQKSIDN